MSFAPSSADFFRDRTHLLFRFLLDLTGLLAALSFSTLAGFFPRAFVGFSNNSTILHIWPTDAFGLIFSTAVGEQLFIDDSSHKSFGDISRPKILAIWVGEIYDFRPSGCFGTTCSVAFDLLIESRRRFLRRGQMGLSSLDSVPSLSSDFLPTCDLWSSIVERDGNGSRSECYTSSIALSGEL